VFARYELTLVASLRDRPPVLHLRASRGV